MRYLAPLFLALLVATSFIGCRTDFYLDGTQWILISDDGETIRYMEFTRGQVRQYTHNLAEDCYDWEDSVSYEVTDLDESAGEGTLEVVDGSIEVNGEFLSTMEFVFDDETLSLSAVDDETDDTTDDDTTDADDTTDDDTDNTEDADDTETDSVDVWETTEFAARSFRPQCADLVTPTPTPTATPTPTPATTIATQ